MARRQAIGPEDVAEYFLAYMQEAIDAGRAPCLLNIEPRAGSFISPSSELYGSASKFFAKPTSLHVADIKRLIEADKALKARAIPSGRLSRKPRPRSKWRSALGR